MVSNGCKQTWNWRGMRISLLFFMIRPCVRGCGQFLAASNNLTLRYHGGFDSVRALHNRNAITRESVTREGKRKQPTLVQRGLFRASEGQNATKAEAKLVGAVYETLRLQSQSAVRLEPGPGTR